MTFPRRCAIFVIVLIALNAWTSPAHANMGLPMLILVWPAMAILLIPIVLIEATCATKILHVGFGYATFVSSVANVVSTIVGIPIAWFMLLMIELELMKRGSNFDVETFRGKMAAVILQSAWMPPYERYDRLLPAACMFLCVPFCLVSVLVEYVVALVICGNSYAAASLSDWAWQANVLSYALIFVLLLFLFVQACARKELIVREVETPLWLERLFASKGWQSFLKIALAPVQLAVGLIKRTNK